jgi:NAD(P)-dependent dehydrogenase (short-subunit alcohol dehydrogenase family)
MTNDERPLAGKVALVAGATRGGGRGIAVELGAAGATVYVTGRSSAAGRSDLGRPETIEQTAAAVTAAPGVMAKTGRALATWGLYQEYGFTDADGTQPDWGAHWASALVATHGPLGEPL